MHGSIRRLFWETCRFPDGSPIIQLGVGLEEHFPWRHGMCIITRVPMTDKGVAIGVWTGYQEQEEDEDGTFLSLRPMDLTIGLFGVQEEN